MISILSMPQQDCISDSTLPHPDQKRIVWFRYIIVSIIRHPTTKCTYQFRIVVLLFIINIFPFSNFIAMRTFHQVLVSHAAYTIKTPFIIWLHFLINFHTKIYSITSYGISDEHDFIRHKLLWNRFTSLLIDKRACSFSILFFWVIPTSKYLPSGFAGHLLINKEARSIPILTGRPLFLNVNSF